MATYRFLNERNFRYFCNGLTLDSQDLHVVDGALIGLETQTGLIGRIVSNNANNGYGPPIPTVGPQIIIDVTKFMHKDGTCLTVASVIKQNRIFNKQPALHINLRSPTLDIPQRIEIPLRHILKGLPSIDGTYIVYLHALKMLTLDTHEIQDRVYYGITKRDWMRRFGEHMKGALSDSPLLFHQALSEGIRSRSQQLKGEPVTGHILVGNYHVICAAGLDEQRAKDTEEYLVGKYSFAKAAGLNMIPGGQAGLAYLHKLRGIGKDIGLLVDDDRDRLLEDYCRDHPRKGLPNPLIAKYWKDGDFAARVICGGENRLTIDQVRDIRAMAELGHQLAEICAAVGLSNELQVMRVVAGLTYSRVK
jgi:hypothetical protein